MFSDHLDNPHKTWVIQLTDKSKLLCYVVDHRKLHTGHITMIRVYCLPGSGRPLGPIDIPWHAVVSAREDLDHIR